ncbi:MAG: hypothetical protein JSS49_13830 [Planctomycetes bacterium]|nr:hypothetical protein [Planctomycetota bacterium]
MAQPPLPNDVGNPDQTGMLPAPYSANYGAYPQQYGGMPGGYPPGANAWPNVSPYMGPPVDQLSNQGGLWFNRQIVGNRKFYFTAEGLIGHTSRPNNFVGDPQANTFPPNLADGNVTFVDQNQQFTETPAGTSTVGTPDRETTFGGSGGGGGNNGNASSGDYPIFVGQSTGSMTDPLNAPGLRGTWGWWNPDQSGFQASGFFLAPASNALFIGDPRGFDQNLYNTNPAAAIELLNHLHAIAGLPLSGADTDQNGLPGVVMPFDIYYRLQMQTQVYGANLDWFGTPILERSAFMIRPMYGARYLQTRETFKFDGADSGLGYTVNIPAQNGTNGNGNGGNGGNNGTSGSTGFLSPVTLEALSTVNIMQSMLTSSVTSQMTGPEAGLRFDIGGERLKVWTQSKFGLLVNYSSRNVSGYNIGDAYYPKVGATVTDPTTMPRNAPNSTRFAHEDSTTQLSPMFEQGIFGKANLFQFVPVLKKSAILSNAEFQAGYTVIVVGNMYRPTNQIDWQAYPVNPRLNDQRSTFITSNYSLGIQWQY